MNKNKILGLTIAAIGLIITGVLLFGAIRFYRTIRAITQNNPSLVAPRDTLRVLTNNDTLVDLNASLNQQIAQKLSGKKEEEKNMKQRLLHKTITDFIFVMDTLQNEDISNEEKLIKLKNAVNRTNMGCMAALFDVTEATSIPDLNSFVITDDKKLGNTIFECFTQKEIQTQCFDKIKHQALHIETIILEKNFKQLNL